MGRRRGRRRGKSDRLDFKSTHRRTLFNVSLTFLLPTTTTPLETNGQRGKARVGGTKRMCNTPPGLHSRSPAPDKVKGQGS